jgi:uncharacterized protein with NAD-binding domain and iron-sulfur cluster
MAGSGATRRGFVVGTGAAAAGLALTGIPQTAAAQEAGRTVAVLGGGVAGLTAAHELAERGYAVTLYERRALGGKARSMDVPGSARGNRMPLPGEHGFRLFPGFYRNLPDTMRRIPFPGNANGVWDNLVAASEMMFAQTGGEEIRIPLSLLPGNLPAEPGLDDIRRTLESLFSLLNSGVNLPLDEIVYFVSRLLVFLTSCDERRDQQWESMPWWEFTRGEDMSEDYRRFLSVGVTRMIVSSKAEVASTRTIATLLEAFVFNVLGRGSDGPFARLLNAPTNEAWIDPWETHLRSLGVEFRIGWTVRELAYGDGRITKVLVEDPDGVRQDVTADHYIQAMPAQYARETWGHALRAADPQLGRCDELVTDWMTGIQFYLTERPDLPHGVANCLDTPWSLTALSQTPHWPDRDFAADYGDGVAVDCVSVDISEWNTPGILYGKTAKECTREEVARETWAQLKAAFNDTGRTVLRDSALHAWHLDPGVHGIGTPSPVNEDALLMHPVGTLHNRPSAKTEIPNLYLAGDYVSVPVDLATMEGANTSGRFAVNALLDQDGSDAERCTVTPLHREPALELLKRHDLTRYRLGLPNVLDLG